MKEITFRPEDFTEPTYCENRHTLKCKYYGVAPDIHITIRMESGKEKDMEILERLFKAAYLEYMQIILDRMNEINNHVKTD